MTSHTVAGTFVGDLPMRPGLVIIRAGNASGKSTCINGIVYALGLERMLSAKKTIPLTPAMTKVAMDTSGEYEVLESYVEIELVNKSGQVMTARRQVVGDVDTKLIQVWDGPNLSKPSETYKRADYFVRDAGSASREAGFQKRLAEFIGWVLPLVSTYDGRECPLYLEAIFPLCFVEQQHGWTGVQGLMPNFLQIKDVKQKAFEFMMGFETFALSKRKDELLAEQGLLRQNWTKAISRVDGIARRVAATLDGIPPEPTLKWPAAQLPRLLFLSEDEKQVSHSEIINELRQKLKALNETASVRPPEQETAELDSQTRKLRTQEQALDKLHSELEQRRIELTIVRQKIPALRRDLQRHQDSKKLRDLGSSQGLKIAMGQCPTCHQAVSDNLGTFNTSLGEPVMNIDESVVYAKKQLEIYDGVAHRTENEIHRGERLLEQQKEIVNDSRARIRALRRTLTSDERYMSSLCGQSSSELSLR